MSLPVRVRVLLHGEDPQPSPAQGRYDLSETPPEEVARLRVLEASHPPGEPRGRQAAFGLGHVITYTFVQYQWLSARRVSASVVPMPIEHLRRRVEVHEHEPSTEFQDGGYAFGPGFEVGEPADDPVGGENDVKAPATSSSLFQPVVDVGAFEERGHAGPRGELAGGGYGLVDDVHPGDGSSPEPGEAERVPARVALEVSERLAFEFPEECAFLGEEGDTALAQKGGEIPAVAVVRSHHRVPRTPVLLAKVLVDHR